MSNWDPAEYDSWYDTGKGRWISDAEFKLMLQLMNPRKCESVLDVGSGTGHFSRRLARAGLHVAAADIDLAMLEYARNRSDDFDFIATDASNLPFADGSFDYCVAVASLCFMPQPMKVLEEMLRIARKAIVLGLLNPESLLFLLKHGRGGYVGARWDRRKDVEQWAEDLGSQIETRFAVFVPAGCRIARTVERLLPDSLPFGGFLAAKIYKI